MSLELKSTAFGDGEAIPPQYTCVGDDITPPLAWTGIPDGTRSLALIVDDPDAPDPQAPRMTFTHWVLYNLPPDIDALPAGLTPERMPKGTAEGVNDWNKPGYGGACPPIGRHRYFHKLYALDTRLDGLINPTKADLEEAMQGHILGQAELVGTFEK